MGEGSEAPVSSLLQLVMEGSWDWWEQDGWGILVSECNVVEEVSGEFCTMVSEYDNWCFIWGIYSSRARYTWTRGLETIGEFICAYPCVHTKLYTPNVQRLLAWDKYFCRGLFSLGGLGP